MRWVLLFLTSFYRWGKWGTKSNLPTKSQLVSDRNTIQTQQLIPDPLYSLSQCCLLLHAWPRFWILVSWGLVGATRCQGPVFFYLIASPSSVLGFHLMFQSGCLGSSHRVCILGSREEKGTKKGIPFPFRNIFWKLHILLLLISPELQLNHMLHLAARGIGKRIFVWSGHVSNLKLWDSIIKGEGQWMLKGDS